MTEVTASISDVLIGENAKCKDTALLFDARHCLNVWITEIMVVHGACTVDVSEDGNRHLHWTKPAEFSWSWSYGCVTIRYHPRPKSPLIFGVGKCEYQLVGQKQLSQTSDIIEVCQKIEHEIGKRLRSLGVRWRNHIGYCDICGRGSSLFSHNDQSLCWECKNDLDRKESASRTSQKALQETASSERKKMTATLRYSVLERDKFQCKVCGRNADDGAKLHVDHIVPVSRGGETVPSNLQVLCEQCNLGKSDKMPGKQSLEFMLDRTP